MKQANEEQKNITHGGIERLINETLDWLNENVMDQVQRESTRLNEE